jgi:tetratricopeptide (TPR) repeat protein
MLLVIAAALALVQEAHSHPAPPATAAVLEVAKRSVTLRTGIGSAHDRVGTTSKQAQALYDQGLAYLHSYVWLEAARSFNQALRLDPKLAIAYAGLSIAYTELNAPPAAKDALMRATALAQQANAHDRRHIEARALQMAAELTPADASKRDAYRAALDGALAALPADEEFWLARGHAESPDPAERGQGSVAGSVRFYQKAMALAPNHFAAHHYLVHAYENTGQIDQALAEAVLYAKMAPAVPHALHMYGHDLRRVGRVDEAIAQFSAADTLETGYFARERIPAEFDWHYQHNLDLLGTSYQYIGQMANAERRLRASFAIPSSLLQQEFNKREWPMFLIARGRAKEALEAANVLAGHRSPVVSATGHVAAGEARLALGEFQAAADEANAALRAIRGVEAGGLVATPLQVLQGKFLLRTGQKDKGRALLEEAARKVRAAPGPDAWSQGLFTLEAIARTARDAGAWDVASWAADQMLQHDPHYAGSQYAHALAAEHADDLASARAAFALARQYWKNADADLPELRQLK